MHHRILSWLCCFALAAVVSLHAQTPAAPAAAGAAAPTQPGLVLAAKVTGTVNMTVNAVTTPIKVDAAIPQNAKIVTGTNSSVVLVFSNGATTQLGANTELVIEEFLQDPFSTSQKVADMTDEPSVSRTKLVLNRGELVGNVKHLKHDKGSTFTVQTPVGAAGIRGTTFRIIFRPGGTGQAFFQLSTVEGNVAFAQPGAAGAQPGGNGAPGADPAAGTPATTTTTANANGTATLAPGVGVPQGQEISLTVSVTQNAQGVMVVTVLPPPVTTTAAITTATMQAVTQVAQDIAVAVQKAVFTPAAAPTTPTGGAGGGTDAGGGGGGKTETTTLSGTTTGTTTTTITTTATTTGSTTTGTTTTTTTTTTSAITAPNFTAQVEATTTTTSPAVTQPPRIVTNPNGNPGG